MGCTHIFTTIKIVMICQVWYQLRSERKEGGATLGGAEVDRIQKI